MKNNIEIERAWIINKLPPEELISHKIPHVISYNFSNESGELRTVRRYMEEGEKFSITVKSSGGLSRQEWEDKDLPEWTYNILHKNSKCFVKKVRYFLNHFDHIIETDMYVSRGTIEPNKEFYDLTGKIRLECEFDSERQAAEFIIPEWMKELSPVEITGIVMFKNSQLALNGWTKEHDTLIANARKIKD